MKKHRHPTACHCARCAAIAAGATPAEADAEIQARDADLLKRYGWLAHIVTDDPAKRAARKTPLYPSHLKQLVLKRNPKAKRRPTARFRPSVVNHAIHDACKKAFRLPENLAPRIKPNGKRETAAEWKRRLSPNQIAAVRAWHKENSWHTHQLRHSASLNFTGEFGLEAARAALGHSTVDMSAMYAGRDLEAAKTVAAGVG